MYTAYDAIEYLLSSAGGGAQDQEHRVLRQGLFHAYRDLIACRDWKWYHTTEIVPVSSASLIVTHRLPWGVSSVDSVYLPQLRIAAEYVDQTEWRRIENSPFQQLVRLVWTVMPAAERAGYYDLKIYNGYRYNDNLTLTYRRRPRDLRLTGWEPSSRSGIVGVAHYPATHVPATATAQMSLAGDSVFAINRIPGYGYYAVPGFTITGGGGSGASAYINGLDLYNGIGLFVVTSGGSGYTSPPTITIDPPPPFGQATAHAVVAGGKVTSVVVEAPGLGYSFNPAVTLSGGGGTGAAVVSVVDGGSVIRYEVLNGGSGYSSAPTVTLPPPPSVPTGAFLEVAGQNAGEAFHEKMEGAIIRFSGSQSTFHPEGLSGMRPYELEAIVTKVFGASRLQAYAPDYRPTGTLLSNTLLLNCKYTVSDLLDLSPTMFTALLSGAEAWVARLLGKNIEGAIAIHGRDLRLAFEHDTLAPASGRRWDTGGYHSFWYLRPGVDQGA